MTSPMIMVDMSQELADERSVNIPSLGIKLPNLGKERAKEKL